MTDNNDLLEAISDESRRSFMKKGAIATGGLALGGSMTATANTNVQQQAGSVILFAYDYHPGRQFQVIANLQQDVVDQVIGRQVEGEPVVSDTSNWNAYIVNYQTQAGSPGEYFLLFTREGGLQQGQSYQLGTNPSYFSSQYNLIEISLGGGGGGNQTGGGGNQTVGGGNQTVGGGETAGGNETGGGS